MLGALDHIVLICANIEAGIRAYETLLGWPPARRSKDPAAGLATALFRVENTALELMAPVGGGPAVDRLTELRAGREGALTSLAFTSNEVDLAHRLMTRRGLEPSAVTDRRSFRLSDKACAGIKTFILPHEKSPPSPVEKPDAISRLDHLVIHTPDPVRAVAHYGGRLGLDFRLDRTHAAMATRFLFFRLGNVIFEIIHKTDRPADPEGADQIWGLAWGVNDIQAVHARFSGAGLNVSDIRNGTKPGTQVFTVRDGTLDIPTLIIATI